MLIFDFTISPDYHCKLSVPNTTHSTQVTIGSQAFASLLSIFSAVSATSAAVSAAFTSSFVAPLTSPPTTFLTTSSVPEGEPGSAASTFPALSTTKTPLVVPVGAFFSPIAEISVPPTSQRRGYGRFCLVLKVVFDLGLSVERP